MYFHRLLLFNCKKFKLIRTYIVIISESKQLKTMKRMYKIIPLTAFVVLFTIPYINAQSSVNAAGSNGTGISFSVGQVTFEYAEDNNYSLTYGVQQSEKAMGVYVTETGIDSLNWSVFPNPSHGIIKVKRRDNYILPSCIIVMNNQGKVILKELLHSNEKIIHLAHLPDGLYNILILSTNEAVQTFKVIKF